MKKAAEAIEQRIAELAPEATADDLVKLADAASKVTHGPQGGAYASNNVNDSKTTYDGRYGVDNTHASAEDRRPTGFGV